MSSFDVIIVGAGISGINTAYRVQSQCPSYSYAILEARESIGGTWDLFRYPGIRSDSDLYTFGFPWHPWTQNSPIASGPAIKQYMESTAKEHGIAGHVLFKHRLVSADWSSADRVWRLDVDVDGGKKTTVFTARFVVFGTGYYDYHNPLPAHIPGINNFKGQVIHPQFWPEKLDYSNKKIVIIGSGATAVTLLPNLTDKAQKVTMLQRSPTYIMTMPNRSGSSWLRFLLGNKLTHKLTRLRWIVMSRLFFLFCQGFPSVSRWLIARATTKQLPKHIPLDPHFKPRYNVWDQRLCICPDGDFYKSFHSGKADVATDTIEEVTSSGIRLNSGSTLDADIIVTATGLKLLIAGGTKISVDGKPMDPTKKFLWHGMMAQDIPNASFIIGYTNASWTLGADATAQFICRLLKYMESKKKVVAVPRMSEYDSLHVHPRSLLNLNSTYITTAAKDLPLAGDRGPWVPRDNYFSDLRFAKHGKIDDSMEFVAGESVKLRAKAL